MDNINHVKIVTPDPEAVDRFLREVVDIPEGWPLAGPSVEAAPVGATATGGSEGAGAALTPEGTLTWESVHEFRGAGTEGGGFITGSSRSRQFQILRGERAHIWAVAIGTRHVEEAHKRCVERGIPCSEMNLVPWGDGNIRAFFAQVGGIVFEVMRVEPKE